jgi:predicted transcriptional regulator
VIPTKFRRRLPEIGDYEVVRSEPSHVTKHHEAALSRLRAADNCLVLTPFFSLEYQAATPDVPETRMLVHRSAVDTRAQRLREGRPDAEDFDEAELRLTECEFAMSVGEGFLNFGLPTQSGDPSKATVLSETDAAVEWGRDLFQAKWDDSDPVEPYIAREHADVWG